MPSLPQFLFNPFQVFLALSEPCQDPPRDLPLDSLEVKDSPFPPFWVLCLFYGCMCGVCVCTFYGICHM